MMRVWRYHFQETVIAFGYLGGVHRISMTVGFLLHYSHVTFEPHSQPSTEVLLQHI